jgi:murein DD-endopeptidase MepM/ murein hydrolase activator NlpD
MRVKLVIRSSLGMVCLLASLACTGLGLAEPCEDWNRFQALLRDGYLPRQEARDKVVEIHRRLLESFGGRDQGGGVAFPLEGGSWRDLGGKAGSGFVAKGYDFYQGNRHGGHPAHDIFIPDRNQDSFHDRTGKPVGVLAFLPGVVVGVNLGWEPGSQVRGGNYVWVFSPSRQLYCYYAHLRDVLVKVGQWVEAGDRLGTVGRTGVNAFPRRSPTHVHFMCLSFDGGSMSPYDPYRELLAPGGK